LRESPRLIRIRDFRGLARCIAAYGEQLMHASVLMNGDGDDEGVTPA
jgi:hypothetical protein